MCIRDRDIKEEIKNSIRLSEVIGKNISLKRRDKSNYIALCPFHKEKTPSFNVSDDKGFFHCFGCGKNGDIFTYVMEMENVTFVDALKKLADQAGINYNHDTFSENPKLKNQLHLLKRVSDSYVQNLNAPIGEKVRNYLYERGINKSIIQNFRIGYSGNLKSNDYLVLRLKEEGFSISDMIEIGLVKENQNKKHIFYFQQRLMIPILNNSGKVIAFGGRLIGEGNPKYLNSPETFLFHKSKQLFGVMNAKKYLNNKRLVVCEGYMDVISLTSHGYPAVASLGTALTENQIENIFNISDEAFLVFDGDNAGQNATLRVFEKYLPKLKLNKKLKFVFLPDRLDPEEFINKNGLNEFEKILDKITPDYGKPVIGLSGSGFATPCLVILRLLSLSSTSIRAFKKSLSLKVSATSCATRIFILSIVAGPTEDCPLFILKSAFRPFISANNSLRYSSANAALESSGIILDRLLSG